MDLSAQDIFVHFSEQHNCLNLTLRALKLGLFFSFFGVPQRLEAGDIGRPTRYCYLESIYHAWDGDTDHRASQCVAVLGGLH